MCVCCSGERSGSVHSGHAADARAPTELLGELETIERKVSAVQVPLSYADIYHADGMWVMPHEWERDNHAYKYGAGKLLHSGYHFVDLLALPYARRLAEVRRREPRWCAELDLELHDVQFQLCEFDK